MSYAIVTAPSHATLPHEVFQFVREKARAGEYWKPEGAFVTIDNGVAQTMVRVEEEKRK